MIMIMMMIKMVTMISWEGVPLSSRDWFASSIRFCSSWEFNNYNYLLAIEYNHMDDLWFEYPLIFISLFTTHQACLV